MTGRRCIKTECMKIGPRPELAIVAPTGREGLPKKGGDPLCSTPFQDAAITIYADGVSGVPYVIGIVGFA